MVWHKVPEANRKKLDVKGRSGMLLSYLKDGNGYRVWDLQCRVVVKTRDTLFEDDRFPYGAPLSTPPEPVLVELPWPDVYVQPLLAPQTPPAEPVQPPTPENTINQRPAPEHSAIPTDDDTPRPSGPTQLPPVEQPNPIAPATVSPCANAQAPTCKSTRPKKQPDRYGSWAKAASTGSDVNTPKTWRQLLKSPTKHKWLKAADEEFSLLLGMGIWRLVPRPAKCKIIKSKWIFKVKRRADNSIQKLKACLVAMGFRQVHGIDYNEVFAPTLRQETFRLVCSLLAHHKWKARQVNFKTALLNGRLSEPVYMEQPQGFEDAEHPDYVCEVHRSIYGLKQSPREWNLELHAALLNSGLTQSTFDPTLYFQLRNQTLLSTVAVHVDDLAVAGEPHFVDDLIEKLGLRFTIGADKDLHHFLSLKINRVVEGRVVHLSQPHYIDDMKTRFLSNCTPNVPTPTDSNFHLLVPCMPDEELSTGPYNQLVGSLLWAAQCTRPDISFAVNKLSQFLRDPSEAHWQAALRVLQYLVSTRHLRLRLGGDLVCAGYSDSDWAEDRADRRSTSAYTFRIGDGAISWNSRKQATVSLSSTKAGYKAMSDSCKEAVWLRNILSELCLQSKGAIPLHVDNAGAEALAKNPEHHTCTKHIDARYHFI
jgi:hypothetical protein